MHFEETLINTEVKSLEGEEVAGEDWEKNLLESQLETKMG